MATGEVLFIFNSLYEPQEENGFWVVNYKQNGEWKKEYRATRELAWELYHKKTRELRDYYHKFLREVRVR